MFKSDLVIQEYDFEHWFLREPLEYETNNGLTIVVPELFSTDLASIPHILRPIIKRGGTHKAAVIHDWLIMRNPYHDEKGLDDITRRDADKIFREALKNSNVSSWKATVMYHGVRAYSLTKRKPA